MFIQQEPLKLVQDEEVSDLKTEFVKSEINQPHPPSGWHVYQTDAGEVVIIC
jgi:hypothetical protein